MSACVLRLVSQKEKSSIIQRCTYTSFTMFICFNVTICRLKLGTIEFDYMSAEFQALRRGRGREVPLRSSVRTCLCDMGWQ